MRPAAPTPHSSSGPLHGASSLGVKPYGAAHVDSPRCRRALLHRGVWPSFQTDRPGWRRPLCPAPTLAR